MKSSFISIPKKPQKVTFMQMFLKYAFRQKTRNRAGYSTCLRYRVGQELGYICNEGS